MVHCTEAGSAPPELARERVRAAAPPATALPELEETVTCCAMAWPAAAANITKAMPQALLADLISAVTLINSPAWRTRFINEHTSSQPVLEPGTCTKSEVSDTYPCRHAARSSCESKHTGIWSFRLLSNFLFLPREHRCAQGWNVPSSKNTDKRGRQRWGRLKSVVRVPTFTVGIQRGWPPPLTGAAHFKDQLLSRIRQGKGSPRRIRGADKNLR